LVITSAIYAGEVRHRRFTPIEHAFRYRLCMLLLDVERIDELFRSSLLWSSRSPAPGWFRRADFLGDPAVPLAEAVRNLVASHTGRRPPGPVMLLANLRYFGVLMNPISCYYCYETDGETLAAVVAEVTSTPWSERHAYVLPASGSGGLLKTDFAKAMHVSPFNPMCMRYHWKGRDPGARLGIHLESRMNGARVFDATLSLRRESLDRRALVRLLLWRFPLMSLRILGAIYLEALRLFIKRAPFYPHPAPPAATEESA
jgi:hypothetical protein